MKSPSNSVSFIFSAAFELSKSVQFQLRPDAGDCGWQGECRQLGVQGVDPEERLGIRGHASSVQKRAPALFERIGTEMQGVACRENPFRSVSGSSCWVSLFIWLASG
jgi:hypothetical protein